MAKISYNPELWERNYNKFKSSGDNLRLHLKGKVFKESDTICKMSPSLKKIHDQNYMAVEKSTLDLATLYDQFKDALKTHIDIKSANQEVR